MNCRSNAAADPDMLSCDKGRDNHQLQAWTECRHVFQETRTGGEGGGLANAVFKDLVIFSLLFHLA